MFTQKNTLSRIQKNNKIIDEIIDIINTKYISETDQCFQIKKLLDNYPSLDLNQSDRSKLLPLHAACWLGKVKISELLISYKADVNAESKERYNNKGENALVFTLYSNDENLPKILLNHGAKIKSDTVCLAAKYNLKMVIPLIVDYGADAHAQDNFGSVLLRLLRNDHAKDTCSYTLATIHFLLERRIDVNAKTGMGNDTALTEAAYRGFYNICNLLLKSGADIDPDGYNQPLSCAVFCNHLDVVKLLINYGADVKDQICDLVRCGKYRPDMIKLLHQYGADVNVLDKMDTNPSVELVNLLLELGADRNKLDKYGKTLAERTVIPEVKKQLETYYPHLISFINQVDLPPIKNCKDRFFQPHLQSDAFGFNQKISRFPPLDESESKHSLTLLKR